MSSFNFFLNQITNANPLPGGLKWKNVHIDRLPLDGQEVLLTVEGVYYMTRYDAAKEVFRLKDEPHSYFSVADKQLMYWLEMGEPEAPADKRDMPSAE
jgi:hypothetical protein